jgi:hypothetical protein
VVGGGGGWGGGGGLTPGWIIFTFDSEWRLALGPARLIYEVTTEGNLRRSTATEA